MTLYINACVRRESRTDKLARTVLAQYGDYTEVRLADEKTLHPLTEEGILRRAEAARTGSFNDPMFDYAKQVLEADTLVIAAPLWDLSFPTILKMWVENICVAGLVFSYTGPGKIQSHARLREVVYVSTSGGKMVTDFGYRYIEEAAKTFLGAPSVRLVMKEMLDA